EDADQRNVINTFRNIGMNLGMVIVNGFSAGLALKFSAEGAQVADGHGYMMVAIIYGIIAVPMFLIVALTGKEVIQPVNEEVRGFSFKETISNLVNNKYLMIITLIMVLQMTAFMGRIAVTAYYVIYCLGSFTMIGLIMTIPSIGGIIGSFFVPFFARKYGKRNVLMVAMAIQAVGLFIMYLAPFDNIKMVLAGDIIFGLFNVGFPMSLSMVSDSVDYMELKSGVRTDGTAYATYGLATKLGNAIGGAFGIMIMSAFGYVANAQQTAEALRGINVTVNLIPAILFVVSASACLLWDMTDAQADEIREQLAGRHSGKSCDEEVTAEFVETAKAM
nr:MFS transporter [Oribacterium sp.]